MQKLTNRAYEYTEWKRHNMNNAWNTIQFAINIIICEYQKIVKETIGAGMIPTFTYVPPYAQEAQSSIVNELVLGSLGVVRIDL